MLRWIAARYSASGVSGVSVAIGGNRWQSVAIGGNRWQCGGISITVLRYEICYMRMTYATVDATDTPSPPELRLDM